MRSLWAIYRREMSHYFVSPIAYVVGGVFLGVAGFFFNGILTFMLREAMQMGFQAAQMGRAAPPLNVPGMVVQNFFAVLGSLTLFMVPMLTMGVYAEEKKRGTIELLMTSPIRDWSIVMGKFFATLTIFAILLVPTLAYQAFLFHYSDPAPSLKILLAGYAGVLLLAAALLVLGAALERAGHPALGREVGELVGLPCGVPLSADVAAALAGADVLIDFTRPEGTLAHLGVCAQKGKAMVIGTTGFTDAQKAGIAAAAKRWNAAPAQCIVADGEDRVVRYQFPGDREATKAAAATSRRPSTAPRKTMPTSRAAPKPA